MKGLFFVRFTFSLTGIVLIVWSYGAYAETERESSLKTIKELQEILAVATSGLDEALASSSSEEEHDSPQPIQNNVLRRRKRSPRKRSPEETAKNEAEAGPPTKHHEKPKKPDPSTTKHDPKMAEPGQGPAPPITTKELQLEKGERVESPPSAADNAEVADLDGNEPTEPDVILPEPDGSPRDLSDYAERYKFPEKICKDIGTYCGISSKLSIESCLLKCAFIGSKILPFVSLMPHATNLACLAANTVFTKLPKYISRHRRTFKNVRHILDSIAVAPSDLSNFAWTGANSLFNSVIKFAKGLDLDLLKPVVEKLDLHDSDQRPVGKNEMAEFSPVFTSAIKPNFNCNPMDTEDEAHMFAKAIEKRPCLMDVLMPGYFVFSRAPSKASSKLIKPLLRAWNMPLLVFTGVGCCMSKFALDKQPYKCVDKQDYFTKRKEGHGMPEKTGPSPGSVCGSIGNFEAPTLKVPLLKGKGMEMKPPSAQNGTNLTEEANQTTLPPKPTGKTICGKKKNDEPAGMLVNLNDEGEDVENCEPTSIRPDLIDYSEEGKDKGEESEGKPEGTEASPGADYPQDEEVIEHVEY